MASLLSSVNQFDLTAFKWCMSRKHAAKIAWVSRFVSRVGDGYLYAVIGVLLLLVGSEFSLSMLNTSMVAFAIELVAYLIFKNGIRRQRPADVIYGFDAFMSPSDKFSFPSGHTAAAFVMASVCAYYFPSLTLLVYGMASAVGVSRVLLGVHFPTDIAAGAVLGTTSAYIAINIVGA